MDVLVIKISMLLLGIELRFFRRVARSLVSVMYVDEAKPAARSYFKSNTPSEINFLHYTSRQYINSLSIYYCYFQV